MAALFAALRENRPAVLIAHSFAKAVFSFSFDIGFFC